MCWKDFALATGVSINGWGNLRIWQLFVKCTFSGDVTAYCNICQAVQSKVRLLFETLDIAAKEAVIQAAWRDNPEHW
jgi:hypothetical protein